MNKELETFITERLASIQKRPMMFGGPDALEAQGYLLLELTNQFCIQYKIDIRETHLRFKSKRFPKCPGPATISWWLQNEEYGLNLPEPAAAQEVANFFSDLIDFVIANGDVPVSTG